MRLASRHRVPVVPRGAGTGLSGGAAGIDGALTIALTRMQSIIEIDRANLCVVTQPGVINAELKAAVAKEGLFYPPDPASYETCSIGGNLGTNAGGLCCVKYGQTRDWVLGLEVVLADGTVIRTGGRTVKDTAGYALTHLFVGSQGTLGIITEATLRLRPLPGPRATLIAFFAIARRGRRRRRGDDARRGSCRSPSSCSTTRRSSPSTTPTASGWTGTPRRCSSWSPTPRARPRRASSTRRKRRFSPPARRRSSAPRTRRRRTGSARRDGSRSARSSGRGRSGWRTSACHGRACRISSRRSSGSRRRTASAARRSGTPATATSIRTSSSTATTPTPTRLTHLVRDEIFRAALDMGGTVTAEHGIGAARREWLPIQLGEGAVAVMRAIKDALDPLGHPEPRPSALAPRRRPGPGEESRNRR